MAKEKMNRYLVLLSGGIDSVTALAHTLDVSVRKEVVGLFVDYGQPQVKQEAGACTAVATWYDVGLRTFDLSPALFRPKGDNFLVPFRNGVLLAIGAAWAEKHGFDYVVTGAYSSPGEGYEYPDSTPEFLGSYAAIMQLGTEGRVRLLAPWQYLTKDQIVMRAIQLEVPLDLTWTCYKPTRGNPCYECPACKKRLWALEEANVLLDN